MGNKYSKKIYILLDNYKGRRFNGPNDLWIAPNGGIYLTDPWYLRTYWKHTTPEQSSENVYYLPSGKKKAVIVEGNLSKPNGIVGTPDGKLLYISDIKAGKTFQYSITSNGSLKDKKLFINQGSDGMTLDNLGNIYLTGDGVSIYSSAGKKIAHIFIPEIWTSNVCFGGKHKDNLFITASKSIYLLHMKVNGVE